MNWFIEREGHLIPIANVHQFMSETCEGSGACAIEEARETLRMVLELFLDGRTTALVSARSFNGRFWDIKGSYCHWWGAEKD